MSVSFLDLHLEKPEAVVKAQEKQKGLNWFLEMLIFIGVFIVVGISQTLLLIPGEIPILAMNPEYQAAVASGDVAKIAEVTEVIVSSDAFAVLSLFSNVGMIVVPILFCRLIQKRKPDTLGFTRKGAGKEYLIGLGMGFIAFSAVVLICVLTGSVKLTGFSPDFSIGMFLLFLAGFMIQGMAEEVMCRGYFMTSLGRRYPMWAAVFANSLIFAGLHLFNNGISVLAFINLILFGVVASLYFVKRGSIWGIGAFHSVWNLVQGNFYGLQVSGVVVKCSVFSSAAAEDKNIINGGAFGPEGGLAVTIVFLVTICILLRKNTQKQA